MDAFGPDFPYARISTRWGERYEEVEQRGIDLVDHPIPELEHFGEIVAGIDVHHREWKTGG